ncbi:MMPL family transporter [Rhodococcus sp. X156]|uniref:MMPL family transporter n=1 Tax=Rhodococcus sp. X156 TaxID=2499145 RepID=UPI000FDBB190|nr:MMPL family transporter [Rhodococcus sp. X156]
MFASWGYLVHRRRRWVLGLVVLAAVLAGVFGAGLFDRLAQGGFDDPESESARAAQLVEERFGRTGGDVLAVYTAPAGTRIDDPVLGQQIRDRLTTLPPEHVASVVSLWTTPAPQLMDATGTRGLAVITLAGQDDSAVLDSYTQVQDAFAVDGVELALAGSAPVGTEVNERTAADLVRAESISLPVVLVLLLFIFGGLVAASLPLVVGVLTILSSLGLLRLLSLVVPVNSFAVNVVTLIGLGLAIDYGLFTVSRFREELAGGRTVADAVARTVATAGRTVAFSATLLAVAMSGLLLFPQNFLKSLGYGGMAAVGMAAFLALTVLPALLSVLGPRIDALSVPGRARRKVGAAQLDGFWGQVASTVMRRPALVAVPIVAVLAALTLPFAGASFGDVSERALPADSAARTATEQVAQQFPALASESATVAISGATPEQTQQVVAAVSGVRGAGPAQPGASGEGVTVLTVPLGEGAEGAPSRQQVVDELRALPVPEGTNVLVGGKTASSTDSLSALQSTLPWMALLLAVATFVLMFLAFGSVILPLKAVLMSALGLGSTLGFLTWIFVDGHGAGLVGITPGPMEAGVVVLMAAIVFGLSTDYEVFLLSRMVEARANGASTRDAVRAGTARTGGVISAAALLLVVVTGAFAFSEVSTMRFLGLGLIFALALDATVVRLLLVPAVIALIGDRTWWAPPALLRLQQRIGLSEHEPSEPGEDHPDRSGPPSSGGRRGSRQRSAPGKHRSTPERPGYPVPRW